MSRRSRWRAPALSLALRTDRLTALAMTGFPPISGPYEEMLRYSRALASVDRDALGASIPEEARAQLPQYVTYYEHLRDFDDRAAQAGLSLPRLCWVGGADEITAGPEKITHIGETVARHRRELEELGGEVEVLPGEDHPGAMAADVVLPRLGDFLDRYLLPPAR